MGDAHSENSTGSNVSSCTKICRVLSQLCPDMHMGLSELSRIKRGVAVSPMSFLAW